MILLNWPPSPGISLKASSEVILQMMRLEGRCSLQPSLLLEIVLRFFYFILFLILEYFLSL